MTEVHQQEKRTQEDRQKKRDKPEGMVDLAERIFRHHTTPFPEAYRPAVNPFPRLLSVGLWLSVLIGGLLGLGFGALLQNNRLVIPGWEGLYSMSPFTFHAFWTIMGIALGILVGGVATLLILSPDELHEDDPE